MKWVRGILTVLTCAVLAFGFYELASVSGESLLTANSDWGHFLAVSYRYVLMGGAVLFAICVVLWIFYFRKRRKQRAATAKANPVNQVAPVNSVVGNRPLPGQAAAGQPAPQTVVPPARSYTPAAQPAVQPSIQKATQQADEPAVQTVIETPQKPEQSAQQMEPNAAHTSAVDAKPTWEQKAPQPETQQPKEPETVRPVTEVKVEQPTVPAAQPVQPSAPQSQQQMEQRPAGQPGQQAPVADKFCRGCGAPREPGARFCKRCGRPFAG